MRTTRGTRIAALLLAPLLVHPSRSDAQTGAGVISGQVVDASTHAVLSSTTVFLEPAERGTFPATRSDGFSGGVRQSVTDRDGMYRFDRLPVGVYVIRVVRIGYESARVEVSLGATVAPRLTFALEVAPIALEPLAVTARSMDLIRADPAPTGEDATRRAAHLASRDRYLETDVVGLAEEDVRSAISFGEADLLRTLQRLPGVSTRDDYTSELWTRGSPWGQTEVYLDGLPLFDPFFGGGVLTSVSPATVGAVFFHPGARPVSIGEGVAGVVRISTRTPQDREGLPFLGEAALGTLQGTGERRFLDGRAGLLVSARRSWFDRLWNGLADQGHNPEGPFDYSVSNTLWRFDWQVSPDVGVVASHFDADDDLRGNAAGLITGSRGGWGHGMDQVALTFPALGTYARVTLGTSRYDARITASSEAFVEPVDPAVVVLAPESSRVRYGVARVELGSETPQPDGSPLSGGIEVVRREASGTGAAATAGTPYAPISDGSLDMVSGWTQYVVRPAPDLTVQTGVRLDLGSPVQLRSNLRVGPHVAVRYAASPGLQISVAFRRSHQYLQQVQPTGARFGPNLSVGHAWTVAGRDVPAAGANVWTLGAEQRLHGGWWLDATVWSRQSTGLALPDPRPGAAPRRPIRWAAGENRAAGAEVLLRRLAGSVTGQLGLSAERSRDLVAAMEFPSSGERVLEVNGLLRWRISDDLAVGGAFTAASGAPYTRVVADPCVDDLEREGACGPAGPVDTRGAANAVRGPVYASLDANLDWVRRHESWGWGLSVQVRNLLSRANRGGYLDTTCAPGEGPSECAMSSTAVDRFQAMTAYPMPFVSLRLWF